MPRSRQSLVEHAPWSEKWAKGNGGEETPRVSLVIWDEQVRGRFAMLERCRIFGFCSSSSSSSFGSVPRPFDLPVKLSLMMTRNNSQCCLIYVPQMSRVPFVTFRTQFNCCCCVSSLSVCLLFGAWLSPFERQATLKWNMAQVHEATSKLWRRRCRCRWQRWAQRRQRRSQRQRPRRRRQRCRLLQSRIYVFNAQFVFSWGGQRFLCRQFSVFSVLGSTHLSVLDVCSGVCLVKRNLAALLKFPARYLVALPCSAKLEPPAGYAWWGHRAETDTATKTEKLPETQTETAR